MSDSRSNHRSTLRVSACVATLMALAAVAATVPAHAGEIIPSLGVTKPVHQGDADASIFGGLAFRGNLAPMLQTEVGVAYRTESRLGGDLKVRQWPIPGSMWLAPVKNLYAGGGVGWYQTTYDFSSAVPQRDFTKQKFGVHLGGGFAVPLGPALAIDMNGRYVYLQKEKGISPPQEFNPDYWSTTAGLAFRF